MSSTPSAVSDASMARYASSTSGACVQSSTSVCSRPCLPPATAYTVAGDTRASAATSSTLVAV